MTKKKKEYLDYAMKIINEEGRVPTYKEIGEHFGVAKTTIYSSIGQIVDFRVARKNIDRCPLCGQRLLRREEREAVDKDDQQPLDTKINS